MPARPLAILPAAAEIDADEDGEGDDRSDTVDGWVRLGSKRDQLAPELAC
jgi:hypothetical protein